MRIFLRILQIGGVAIFCLVILAVILFAEGYQYDSASRDLVKKSVIYFDALPEDAVTYLDGKQADIKISGELRVLPGLHSVEILKEGYETWKKNVMVKEDELVHFKEIQLFPAVGLSTVLKIVQPLAGWTVRSFSEAGVLLENRDLHYAKHYYLKPGGRFQVLDMPFTVDAKKMIALAGDKIMGLSKKGDTFEYDNRIGLFTGGNGSSSDVFSDIQYSGGNVFAARRNGEIFVFETDGAAWTSKLFFSVRTEQDGVDIKSFRNVQHDGAYFSFVLERSKSNVLVVATDDGSIVFQEGAVDSAFVENGKVYYTKGLKFFVYDLDKKQAVSSKNITQRVKWMCRLGDTYHFLFLAGDSSLLYCDEDFENCRAVTSLKSRSQIEPLIVSSEDRTLFFTIFSGQLMAMEFGKKSFLPSFLQDLVSGIF